MQNRKMITVALMIATFLASIEGTIVSTAMASIANDLQGVSLVSWVFAIYMLTISVSTLIYGKLADLYGRRRIFTLGTIIFLLGSMLCGLSQNMHQLIAFRALQGLGAGAVLPITTTIVGDIYPYEKRAKIQGLFSAIWAISGITAPLIGGFLVDTVSWRWIFYINLPFGILALILLWIFYHEKVDRHETKQIDYLGALLFTVAITCFLLPILLGGTYFSWTSPYMIGLFVSAFILMTLFLYVETKVVEPLLPLSLFRIPTVTFANVSGFLLSMILIGINIYLPIWIQGIHGYGATGAGLTLAPLGIGWVTGSNTIGQVLPKWGPKKSILIGFSCLLIGTFGLSQLTTTMSPWMIMGLMILIGFGFGFSMTTTVVLGQSGMQDGMRGVASATNGFLRSLGQTVGAAIFGALFNYLVFRQLDDSKGYTTGDLEKILNPETSQSISPEMLSDLREVLFTSVHMLFIFMCMVAVVSLIIGFKFPKQPPKEHTQ